MGVRLFFSAIIFGALFFGIAPPAAQAIAPPLLLSEVSTSGEKSTDEFIELFNTSDIAIDLSGMQLRRRTTSGSESSIKVFSNNALIPAHGYYLWANSQGIFAAPFADTETSSSSLADNNSIGLFTQSGAGGILIDSIAWGTGSPLSPNAPVFPNPGKNTSLTRDITTLTWTVASTRTPTNSRGITWTAPVPDPLPTPDPAPLPSPAPSSPVSVRINEILSNPIGDEAAGEFIELINDGATEVDISGFTLHDASKTGSYTFPKGTVIKEKDFFVLRRSVSKLSLNNSDETLSLFDASASLIDSVRYEKTKEGISQNRVGNALRGGIPTPGFSNQINALPETKEKVPKKGYRGVAIAFDARGKDSDGGKLKYTWDFGDGHKSYKEKTSHKYEENGTYQVTLTTTDGSDDVIETFTLKIESFPKPEVRIIALVPNPSDRDSDAEYLIIENRDKKAVDLKGYSIATGWKKLTNHPIRENFIIAPKSQAKLTREFSLFTLPNQKGKIELRAPDGKALQDIKYKLEKSVAEDVIYHKEKGKRWAWKDAVTNGASEPAPLANTVNAEVVQEESAPEQSSIAPEIVEPVQDENEMTAPVTEEPILEVTTDRRSHRKYLALLNYGTGVKIPEHIMLSFPPTDITPVPKQEPVVSTFVKAIFENINLTLNTLQNDTWDGQAL